MGNISRGRPNKLDPAAGKGSVPPQGPGVCRFREKRTGRVEYVGKTNNVERRLLEHAGAGKLDFDRHTVEWKTADGRSTSRTLGRRRSGGSKSTSYP